MTKSFKPPTVSLGEHKSGTALNPNLEAQAGLFIVYR